ncbi:MAG TPA: MFS transporter [Planctomycetaceae bacterium]|nr:MFS transporter [Planctomycetaceae bacterium]
MDQPRVPFAFTGLSARRCGRENALWSAYGLERAGDMLGAVSGPLLATLLLWCGIQFRSVILWTLVPGVAAAACLFFLTRERSTSSAASPEPDGRKVRSRFPKMFWLFLVGVLLFGLGDFSRTFLIWLAARTLGETASAPGTLSIAALLYALHNLVSAAAAYPVGWLGDRRSKLPVLVAGYGLGVLTNGVLALYWTSLPSLTIAIVLSGVYIAIEETLEKAVAAEWLPRDLRSLGFGILACTNAVGDMASSLYVGLLLQQGASEYAFGIAVVAGTAGVVWMAGMVFSLRLPRG